MSRTFKYSCDQGAIEIGGAPFNVLAGVPTLILGNRAFDVHWFIVRGSPAAGSSIQIALFTNLGVAIPFELGLFASGFQTIFAGPLLVLNNYQVQMTSSGLVTSMSCLGMA